MTNPTFSFQTLTPDLILDAIESTGIRIDSGLTELNSYENRVFQLMDEERQRYVAKFYRPERWSDSQIGEEHGFARELSDSEIPVVAPLSLNGQTLHHLLVMPLLCFQAWVAVHMKLTTTISLNGLVVIWRVSTKLDSRSSSPSDQP